MTLRQRFTDTIGSDLDDAGVGVVAVGHEARLAARERLRRTTGVVQRHAQQRHRLAFARSDEHVHLTTGARLGHLGRQTDQLVGLLTHRADDDDHVVAVTAGTPDMISDLTNAIGIGNRRATELLHDESHGPSKLSGDKRGEGSARDEPQSAKAGAKRRPQPTISTGGSYASSVVELIRSAPHAVSAS